MPRDNDPGHRFGCPGAKFRAIRDGKVNGQLRRRRCCDNCGTVQWYDKPGKNRAGRWRRA